MKRLAGLAIVGAGILAGLMLLRHRAAGREARGASVLLVTIDTLRADRVGAYGARSPKTPRLDALAREGVVFEEAYASAPLTLPSHATILSGLDPPRHGVHDNGSYRFPDDRPTLATILKGQGYATGAFVGAYVLDRRFGLARGFDVYDDRIERVSSGASVLESQRRCDDVVSAAEAWLQKQSGPFLAWAHFYDPHAPYDPPEPERGAYPDRPYDAEVAHADACFGRIQSAARHAAGERLLTLVVADHGEALGDHGERTHGFFVYGATLRVPLLLSGPGIPAGERRSELARTGDVLPTLLALLGVSPPEVDGREILRQASLREAYAETEFPRALGYAPLASFRSGALKYIEAPRPELYDVRDDPGETRDLAAARPADTARLRAALSKIRSLAAAPVAAPLDAQASERLRALGYVSAGGDGGARSGRDPKDALADWLLFEDATGRSGRGEHASALASFHELVGRDPQNPGLRRGLAAALQKAGRPADALAALDSLVALVPTDALAWQRRAALLLEQNRLDAARESVARALAVSPDAPETLVESGVIEARAGRSENALAAFERALRIDPTNARAWTNQGNVLRDLGGADAARAAYTRAAELAPRDADPPNGLGVLAAQSGQSEAAVGFFERALALDPSYHEARLNLAVAEASRGRKDAARARAEEVVKLSHDPKLVARARAFLSDLPRFAVGPAPR